MCVLNEPIIWIACVYIISTCFIMYKGQIVMYTYIYARMYAKERVGCCFRSDVIYHFVRYRNRVANQVKLARCIIVRFCFNARYDTIYPRYIIYISNKLLLLCKTMRCKRKRAYVKRQVYTKRRPYLTLIIFALSLFFVCCGDKRVIEICIKRGR